MMTPPAVFSGFLPHLGWGFGGAGLPFKMTFGALFGPHPFGVEFGIGNVRR